jgi:outer membrane protein assembly factor BamB
VLTSDRRQNSALQYRIGWQDDTVVASRRVAAIGSILSSPLVANGTIYFSSSDGNLYAIE